MFLLKKIKFLCKIADGDYASRNSVLKEQGKHMYNIILYSASYQLA